MAFQIKEGNCCLIYKLMLLPQIYAGIDSKSSFSHLELLPLMLVGLLAYSVIKTRSLIHRWLT